MTLGKKLKRHRGWFAVAAIVVIAGIAIYLTRGSTDTAAAPTYTTEAAAKGTISVTVDGTGNLAVRDEVDAYPEVSGTVSKVYVDEGDEVSEGDVLYTLSATDADKTIASAKAAKQQASTALTKANLDLYKAKVSLSKLEDQADEPSSTVTSSDIKIAKKEVTIASAGVTAADLTLDSAQDDYSDALDSLDDLEVKAPCDGIVWSVDIEKGDSVSTSGGGSSSSSSAGSSTSGGTSTSTTTSSSSSSSPMTIAKDGKMGVEMTINEVDVTTLEDGQDAEVAFDAIDGLTMTGKIDGIDKVGTVSSSVVSYNVWLTLDGTDARLKSGMSSTVTIVTDVARDVLLVSNSAVKSADDGGSYVQVMAQGATTPTDVTVTTGLSSSTQTEITSGLNEGDMVVTQTSTASSSSDSSDSSGSSSSSDNSGGGIMMMGAGGPPSGGPGGQ